MNRRVLIVDDSMVSRMMIKEIIESQYPDWDFVQAASADKAIEACKESQFDFITLDLNMPGINGLDAAPAIMASQKKVKIALLTANIQPATKQKASEFNISFIAKPINTDSVLAFVNLGTNIKD